MLALRATEFRYIRNRFGAPRAERGGVVAAVTKSPAARWFKLIPGTYSYVLVQRIGATRTKSREPLVNNLQSNLNTHAHQYSVHSSRASRVQHAVVLLSRPRPSIHHTLHGGGMHTLG